MRVLYNGVTLTRVETKKWQEDVQYDESGMNMLGSRVEMTFEGTITESSLEGYAESPHSEDAAIPPNVPVGVGKKIQYALRALEMPRANLIVYDDIQDAEPIFAAYAENGLTENSPIQNQLNMDVAGGPKPISVRIVYIVNGYARVEITFVVNKIRCLEGETTGGDSNNLNPRNGFVISNRCWTDETIDENFYTTKKFTGRLRVSSANQSVLFYRQMFYPPLERGFYRESVNFSESEDGLTLNYTVTDKQRRNAAPYPATKVEGEVQYHSINSGTTFVAARVSMIGAPFAPKQALVARALEFIRIKIDSFTKDIFQTGTIQDFVVSENIGDPPAITVSLKMLTNAREKSSPQQEGKTLFDTYIANLNQIGSEVEFNDWYINGSEEPVAYKRYESQKPDPYGYQVYSVYDSETSAASEDSEKSPESPFLGYIKCLATVPCAMRPPVYAKSVSVESDFEQEEVTVVQRDTPNTGYGTEPTGVAQDAIKFPWTFYKSHIIYDTDNMVTALPSAINPLNNGGGNPVIVRLAGALPKARVVIEAERANAIPSFPDPYNDEVISAVSDQGNPNNITFTPVRSRIQHSEPKRGTVNNDVVYVSSCEIEYVLSRKIGTDEQVYLLENPTYQSTCYYPVNRLNQEMRGSFSQSFLGGQLTHQWVDVDDTPTVNT
ncbi:MAG: hypothetical protein J6W10_04010 [Kiritimatiellae bacterium]|nr:hypothetical protein [Kiritimatiellia bacterium]